MIASLRSLNARWFRAAKTETPETAGASDLVPAAEIAPKIGLALSCGGARGLAHVGVIQVLEEEGIPVSAIAGTSMGAYVGSLWAAGLNGAKLESLAREIKDRKTVLKLLDPLFPPSEGLIRGDKIRRHLERSLGHLDFTELAVPLLVIATDIDSLSAHVFDSGSVAAAVHASSAIPGVCAPVRLNRRRYIDGGASEPLPVTLLKARFGVDVVIAVNAMPTSKDIEECRDTVFEGPPKVKKNVFARGTAKFWKSINLLAYGNVIDTFRRSLMSAQLRLVAKECERAEVVVHPFFCKSTWYDFENFDLYIAAGREAARAALPQIRELVGGPRSNPHSMGRAIESPARKSETHETAESNSKMGLNAA